MLDKVVRSGSSQTVCYLVEVIAKKSQDVVWNVTVTNHGHKDNYSYPNIRRISMDKFYDIVFQQPNCFFKLCKVLSDILDDVISDDHSIRLVNTVYEELDKADFYRSLYLLAFKTYEEFEAF